MTDGSDMEKHQETGQEWKARLKKLGWIGFLLFLLKGIVWLVLGYLLVRG